MAASDFNWNPHRVEPQAPVWNVARTQMQGTKVKTRLISTVPIRNWTLFFHVQTNAQREAFLAHYNGQCGDFMPFYWYSIPVHILGTDVAPYWVRYKTYKETPTLFGIWEIEISFEENIS